MDQLVNLPVLHIKINGQDLSHEYGRQLSDIRIQQKLSLPSLCELNFIVLNEDIPLSSVINPADALSLSLGDGDEYLFEGQVTAIERKYGSDNLRQVRIRAYDKLHLLRKRQNLRIHTEVTFKDLAKSLLSTIDIEPRIDEAGPVWKSVVQNGQSDLELLAQLSERCGQYYFLDQNALNFYSMSGNGDPKTLEYGKDLIEARVISNAEPACKSVQTTAWDPWRAEEHIAKATAPRSARSVEMDVSPDKYSVSGEQYLVDRSVQDDTQAEAIAQSELDRRIAGEIIFTGAAIGSAKLRPGTRIKVKGLNDNVNGTYTLTAVTHVVDHVKGYVSILDTAPPATNNVRQNSASSTLGIVTRVDDPDGLGRIRVKLPSYNNIETEWLHTVIPGAGEDKGIIALNNKNDKVLVHFVNNDPAQAVVLGGLYGTIKPPDAGVVDGEIKHYTMMLPDGQSLLLDSEKHRIVISNGSNSKISMTGGRLRMDKHGSGYVEISKDKFSIHSEIPLEIDAPGQPVTIKAESIDLVKG